MSRIRLAVAPLLVATALAALPAPAEPQAPVQDSFAGVGRIVAVGDVHGGYDEFVAVLRAAGVIDGRRRWTGGAMHLVQTGDVLDRGSHSKKVMDLLMSLEKEAIKARGRVHALIGNHEVMNILGDLRYVSADEYAAFRTGGSAELRERAFALLADPARLEDAAYRRQWEEEHPLGWVEHRQAFAPEGKYGKWIRQHNAVVRINDLLFLHGGIAPSVATLPVGEINARVRQELADPKAIPGGLAVDENGPLWYRGLAQGPEADLAAHVDRVLELHKAKHIVVGHTIVAPAIIPRFDGKVVTIDVGLSPVYGGPPAALVVEQNRLFALHRGRRFELPRNGELRPYLEALAAVDPAPSPLREVIQKLSPLVPAPVGAALGVTPVRQHAH
jgi:hypothetical protein